MVRHELAARSLRHRRFAHRMLASQPLLARASHTYHPTIAISFDGHQLPMGRILRRLPLNESPWIADGAESSESGADATSVPNVATPAETLLRLLPRLPETHDSETTSATPAVDVGAPLSATTLSDQTQTHRVADDAPPAPITPTTSTSPTRADGVRPRSRIVELPGTVSLPVEEPIADEPSAPDVLEDLPEDAPVNARAGTVADTQVTAGGEPSQPPLMPEEGKEGEEPAAVSPTSAQITATEDAPPAPPAESAPAPSRRSKHTPANPPRASDALFPPTDADRSPAAWLARLQHTDKPTSPTRPDPLTKPGNEPSPSTPVQRPGTRGSRKGAIGAQASKAPAPPTQTASATPPSPEQSLPEEQPSPLPNSSRTLLHTLTGIDPANVRIYRGPVAARVTSDQNAEALTDSGAIALGAGHSTDTPETLGLLAHELTHIAQRRSPRFVPPVSLTSQHQERADFGTSASVSQESQPAASPADEEAQATQVEARVTKAARAKATPPQAIQPALPVESAATTVPAHEQASRAATQPVWGDLPAPWEPLPTWMTTPTDSSASAPQPTPQPSAAPARAPSANIPGTQRAERGRSLSAETEESSPAQIQETSAPEPDLDLLAQQVHAILKRRLAAERRRLG